MIKSIINIFIGIVLFLSVSNCVAQKSLSETFYSSFQEVTFDVLHVYSFSRVAGKFPQSSLYPYKGVELDNSYHKLLNNVFSEQEITSSIFYATFRFKISDHLEALLIREFLDTGMEHHIHYLVYNKTKNELIKAVKLSYSYDYEGSSGGMESWITDLNNEGQMDILSRSTDQRLLNMNADEILDEKVFVSVWKDDKLNQTEITDTLLIKEIATDFPYYRKSSLSYTAKKRLETFLKENESSKKSDGNSEQWCIVVGSDKDLQSAKHEKKRCTTAFKGNKQNEWSNKQFEIYKKNNRYYTLISIFKNKSTAEKTLITVKKKFNNTSYLINLQKWCLESEYKKEGFTECIN